jgi:hypothetical protein
MEHEHGAFKVNRDIAPARDRDSTNRLLKIYFFRPKTLASPRCDAKYPMPEI